MRSFHTTLKKVAIVLCIVLLPWVLNAKTIEVWLPGHSNEELQIIRQLTEDQFTAITGVEVVYTSLGWADIESRFLMAAASGEAPDVGGSGSLFIPELGLRGAMMDLSSLPGFSEVYQRGFPGFYRSLKYQDLTFGIPYTAAVTVAFQRDDILQSLGIENIDTWDELKQALPKMQANGTTFALQWFMSETLYADVNMFMWQRGADDYNKDLTKSGYDDPECITGFTDYVELYTKYKIPKEIPVQQSFLSGELALCLGYPPFYQNLTYGAPQISGKWSLVQAPGYIVNGKTNRTTTGGGQALGIFNSSKNKTESWEFIKWITAESTQLELSNRIMESIKGALFLPSNQGAVAKSGVDKKAAPVFEKALLECTSSVYGLVAPRHRRRYLQMAAQKAVLYLEDPKVAMVEAAMEHNAEIAAKQIEYERFIKKLLDKK